MTTTSVPPQAYTKAELAKAYQWLIEQAPEIKDMANSPDSLMGLYRKAQIYGTSSILPNESKSSAEFRSELKDIATQLGRFGSSTQKSELEYSSSVKMNASKNMPPWVESSRFSSSTANSSPSKLASKSMEAALKEELSAKNSQDFVFQEPPLRAETTEMSSYPTRKAAPLSTFESFSREENNDFNSLDSNSRAMLNEARRKLNLSSDREALRMLISLGYERLKSLF